MSRPSESDPLYPWADPVALAWARVEAVRTDLPLGAVLNEALQRYRQTRAPGNTFRREHGEFGFGVYRPGSERWDQDIPGGCWALTLPHHCGRYDEMPHECEDWPVAVSADRGEVLAEARRFRDELDTAIRELGTAGESK